MDLEELIDKYKNEDGSLTIPKEFIPFITLKKEIEKGVCLECGKEFIKTHGHQKFCPPKPGRKISTCQNTYNQRKKRERKKVNKGERVIQ